MIGTLLLVGITLSLDNFRTALALGALRLTRRRALHVALVFGFWDGVAPLVGILIGGYFAEAIGETGELVGSIVLGAYGLYIIIHGLPLPLSLDNVVAGTSLGLLGYSPWLAPPLFGAITFLMTFVGLELGKAATRFIHIRADLLTGVALVIVAVVGGLGLDGLH